ncbi:MAG: PaaI family thioesterase [Ilumatobacter sp.]|uniref:PaaI family thioesterase n=1 Tax=Ilumatobacter sp. TaxID=1967498 RepID=UPI0026374788|nr:PaaI family thioesterase [Ilumatobacter sp.]MDJ0767155.1 PaaI family thioesterase [Ilumatobacter sp.]
MQLAGDAERDTVADDDAMGLDRGRVVEATLEPVRSTRVVADSLGQDGSMTVPEGSSPATGNTPDRPLAGMRHVEVPDVEPTTELADRRKAVAELGAALRDLTSQAIGSEVAVDVMRRVAEEARGLAAALTERQRRPDERSSVDDLGRGQRPFNPVVGLGNPVAPPMRVEIVDGVAIGSCTLDWRYEGPFTFAHGGVSAMLLDQIMGYAAAAADHPGVTGRLEVRYRSTVPLGEPLRLEARLIDVLGVRAAVRGSIGLAADPDTALVEAEGRFLALRPEQAARLFGGAAEPAD